MRLKAFIECAFIAAASYHTSAAAFRNLGFEEALLPPPPVWEGAWLDTATALPGWQIDYLNWQGRDGWPDGPDKVILYDRPFLSGSSIVLRDSGSVSGEFSLVMAWEGPQTFEEGNGTLECLAPQLWQTGRVPAGTRSVRFHLMGAGEFTVSLGGVVLAVLPLGPVIPSEPRWAGADATSFGGIDAELRFTMTDSKDSGSVLLDDIQFSSIPIPEPNGAGVTLGLLSIIGLWWSIRRRSHRS